jgi:hypothetical protein
VLIGSGTLRAEGNARLVGCVERRARRRAAGLSADPVAVVLSRGRTSASSSCAVASGPAESRRE